MEEKKDVDPNGLSQELPQLASLTKEQRNDIEQFLAPQGIEVEKVSENTQKIDEKPGLQAIVKVETSKQKGQESTAQIKRSTPQIPREESKKEPKKKKDRALSQREATAVAMLQAGYSKKDALITAGYSPITASTNPTCVLGKPIVQRALMQAFEKRGITAENLANKHAELLDAKKTISALVIGDRDKDADDKTFDFVEVPDSQVQVKALELAYKVRGDLAPEVHAVVTESYSDRIKRIRGITD